MWFMIVHVRWKVVIRLANNSILSQGAWEGFVVEGLWEGFVVEGLQISWKMALGGLDLGMIVNLYDIVERRINETIAQVDVVVDASFSKRVEKQKKEVGCYWIWSLLIRNRVFYLVRRISQERRWNHKVEVEEFGFVD